MAGEATAQPSAEGTQPEATTAAAQPGQGRGDAEDHLAGLYDLSDAPEHLQPFLEEELRKINAGVGRRFQEHAEQRSQWEPLTKIEGLSDVPAEDLQDLLTIRNMIAAATSEENPDSGELYDWWDKVGEHFGFFEDDGAPPEEGGEPEADEEPPAWAQQLMERLETAEQRLDGTDRQTQEQKAAQAVQTELTQLSEKHGLDDKAQNRVLQLAYAYGGQPDALQRGLKDYFEITGQAEGDLLEGAQAPPGPTTTGGQPATHEGEPLRFGDPRLREAAMARVKGQTSAGAAA